LPGDIGKPRDLPGIELDPAAQIELLNKLNYHAELEAFPATTMTTGEFAWDNGMYGPGDGEIYYSLIRYLKPKRIIEIGSGASTLLALAASRANLGEDVAARTTITCVEPYENPWLAVSEVELVRERVEDLDMNLFASLAPGDMLFIDSSHVIRPGGDVTTEILRILPRLQSGVLVHIHDIFTPRDYPEAWLRHERRLWNEQYMLEAWLSGSRNGGRRAEVVCALNWLKNDHWEATSRACPILARHAQAQPGAFWFRVA
jgi:predicted O-methyltransferase YrrM